MWRAINTRAVPAVRVAVPRTFGEALLEVASMHCACPNAEGDRHRHAHDPNNREGGMDAFEDSNAVHGYSPFWPASLTQYDQAQLIGP